jgi:hypothetical protein
MGRRGRSGRLPPWYRGQKRRDDVDGSEHGEYDLLRQRGLWVSKKNYDSLTDLEREEQIRR